MIDFGMAVKYDHGVWFKARAARGRPGKIGRFGREQFGRLQAELAEF